MPKIEQRQLSPAEITNQEKAKKKELERQKKLRPGFTPRKNRFQL